MLEILAACGAMAVRDALGTLNTIAQARGRAWMAGTLDAFLDLASILVTLAGAGVVIQHGWSGHTVLIISTMMLTSFLGTAFWTWVGDKWTEEKDDVGEST